MQKNHKNIIIFGKNGQLANSLKNIFADKNIQIKSFETLNDFYNSDHFPLISRLEIK
jgi:dTDP-4-dehydrorhamnose reductase